MSEAVHEHRLQQQIAYRPVAHTPMSALPYCKYPSDRGFLRTKRVKRKHLPCQPDFLVQLSHRSAGTAAHHHIGRRKRPHPRRRFHLAGIPARQPSDFPLRAAASYCYGFFAAYLCRKIFQKTRDANLSAANPSATETNAPKTRCAKS